MKYAIKIGAAAALVLFLGAGCAPAEVADRPDAPSAAETVIGPETPPPSVAPELTPQAVPPAPPPHVPAFAAPIDHQLDRTTKKPFGLKVSPKSSPISPERFTGYHTGLDFETTPDEQETDVAVDAVCDGTLAVKEYASGYGGLAVERCKLDGTDITVIYGHLRLSSIAPKAGQAITAGETIAVLGTGYSKETDGERRHLHLGVHKGAAINIKGYVQRASDLSGWIDPLPLLK